MRTFLFFPAILFFSISLQAQDYRLELADRFFENKFYSDAIPLYENLTDKRPQTMLNLADAYRYTFQLEKAEHWYGKMVQNYPHLITEEYAFRYVQVLKALEKSEQKENVARKFLLGTPEETEAYESDLDYLESVKKIGNRYTVENLPLNTAASEFGGTNYKGNFVFAASRKKTGLFSKMFRWDDLPYLDLYSVPEDRSEIKEASLFSEELTTRLHESNPIFSADGNTIYFTRNNHLAGKTETDSANVTNLKIYKAEWNGTKWEQITSLPFNSDSYSTEHPALSPDGKTLYFSSNMPGGHGSFDLYQVNTTNYNEPENLGPKINTEHKEQFPFIDSDGNLYFASDGHPTFGFLDVFVSKPTDSGFENPDNVGLPVNSGYDDFAFSIDASTKKGYFSSNRPTGKGSDDIYKIQQIKPLNIDACIQIVSGKVVDKSNQNPLQGALIKFQINSAKPDSLIVGEDASFTFDAICGNEILITAKKEGYTNDTIRIETSSIRNKTHQITLALSKNEAEDSILTLSDKEKSLVELENEIIQNKRRLVIKTEPIHFDYDLWNIREKAQLILEKVIGLMEKYPSMKIEIGAHTDIRGSDQYNGELSGKRAVSVMEYLIEKGIDPSRLAAKGYGESTPIIECSPENSCTNAEHEMNRRCEFVITEL